MIKIDSGAFTFAEANSMATIDPQVQNRQPMATKRPKRGVPEGPLVAQTLRQIEDKWVAAGFPSGEQFQRIVDDALRSAR